MDCSRCSGWSWSVERNAESEIEPRADAGRLGCLLVSTHVHVETLLERD